MLFGLIGVTFIGVLININSTSGKKKSSAIVWGLDIDFFFFFLIKGLDIDYTL